METTRTDIHRPVEFDPTAYRFVLCGDNQPPLPPLGGSPAVYEAFAKVMAWYRSQRELIAQKLQGTALRERGTSQCHHCGAHIRYFALMLHLPTGTHVAVGEQCLEGRFELESKAEFDRLRKAAELDRQKQRIARGKAATLEAHPEFQAVLDAVEAGSTNEFLQDVVRKFNLYGDLSDRQLEATVRAVQRDRERAERQASEPVEATTPVPTGRVTLQGEVLSTKWVESDFGSSLKMLVKVTTPEGSFKVWGSVPSKLQVEKGDQVRFDAAVEASHDDPSFGFFKRPTKAAVAVFADSDQNGNPVASWVS